jgi:hypothetical protein
VAVSVKTFVLCLGASFGMQWVSIDVNDVFRTQVENCGQLEISGAAWRIPLYLLCSAACLGQYRFPLVDYGRGLVVTLSLSLTAQHA